MAGVLSALLDAIPENARGLAVSHTPLIERGVLGLTAREIDPLAECEGVRLARAGEEDELALEEIRLSP
jgi:hypothetical protein